MLISPLSFYKCLSDDTRLKILLLVQLEQALCVCELTAALDVSQPKISRHLAQLRQCGLLMDRREGQWVFYQIHPKLSVWAADVIANTATYNGDYIEEARTLLNSMQSRPPRSWGLPGVKESNK